MTDRSSDLDLNFASLDPLRLLREKAFLERLDLTRRRKTISR